MFLSVENFDKTEVGCPFATPFRCSNLNYQDCKALPYTSYASLYSQACETSLQTFAFISSDYLLNSCVSSVTPFACGDGSCVASTGDCASTCSFFCQYQGKCVSSEADCTALQTTTYTDLN